MATRLPNGKSIEDHTAGFEVIAARSTTQAAPDWIVPTGESTTVRTYLAYTGTVSSCDLTLWQYLGASWYAGPTVADALTGTDEYRDWAVEPGTLIGFTVSEIAGGGSVAVRARGIVDGTA